MRSLTTLALLTCLVPSRAYPQAPPTAPLALTVPASARVAALGNAWEAGRDQDVVFSSPAQLIGVRSDFSVSLARRVRRFEGGHADDVTCEDYH